MRRRDAELLQRLRRLADSDSRERGQDPVGRLDQQDPRLAGVDALEVVLQRVTRELADLAGDLDPGRAAADDDERQLSVAVRALGRDLGALERVQDPRAHRDRALE